MCLLPNLFIFLGHRELNNSSCKKLSILNHGLSAKASFENKEIKSVETFNQFWWKWKNFIIKESLK